MTGGSEIVDTAQLDMVLSDKHDHGGVAMYICGYIRMHTQSIVLSTKFQKSTFHKHLDQLLKDL